MATTTSAHQFSRATGSTENDMKTFGTVFTFYSYKGGVGRSMALANVAHWMSCRGLDVLMVDWDLEAPGLESFFFSEPDEIHESQGLVDLIDVYCRQYERLKFDRYPPGDPRWSEEVEHWLKSEFDICQWLRPVPTDSMNQGSQPGRLRLLPAGRREKGSLADYARKLQSLAFEELYRMRHGRAFFSWLGRSMAQVSDIALIDSRTGITDMGGVCTRELPKAVVAFVGATGQSIEGVRTMVRSFVRGNLLVARGGQPLEVMCVPTRIDQAEREPPDVGFDNGARFRDRFERVFAAYTPPSFLAHETTFWDTRIPYEPQFAFFEPLVVRIAPERSLLSQAYRRLAAHVSLMAPEGSRVRQQMAGEVRRLLPIRGVHVVIVQFGPVAVEDFEEAWRAAGDLRCVRCQLSADDAPAELVEKVRASLAQCRVVVLVGTLESLDGEVARHVYRAARECGCTIRAWVAPGLRDASAQRIVPAKWVSDHRIRLGEPDSLSELGSIPVWRDRAPFQAPKLPRNCVRREELLDDLIDKLRTITGGAAAHDVPPVLFVFGPAKWGKSLLVTSLCHEPAVRDLFPDGILWVESSQSPDDVHARRKQLCAELGPVDQPTAPDDSADVDFWNWNWSKTLEGRRCLLVIDGARSRHEIAPLLLGGSQCVRLVVSRRIGLGHELDVDPAIRVGRLNAEQSRRLLGAELDLRSDALSELQDLRDALMRWPLALAQANRLVRSPSEDGAPSSDAPKRLREGLKSRGLSALGDEVDAAWQDSWEQLPLEESSRLVELALDCERDVSLEDPSRRHEKELVRLWNIDERAFDIAMDWLVNYQWIQRSGEYFDIKYGVVKFVCGKALPEQRHGSEADRLYRGLSTEAERETMKRVLLRLVELGHEWSGPDRTVPVSRSDLEAASSALLAQITEIGGPERDRFADSDPLEVSPGLLDGWPRWRGWVREDRPFLWWRQCLRAAMRSVSSSGDIPEGNHCLDAVARWLPSRTDDLYPDEIRFIEAEVRLRDLRMWLQSLRIARERSKADLSARVGSHLSEPRIDQWLQDYPHVVHDGDREFLADCREEASFRAWRQLLADAMAAQNKDPDSRIAEGSWLDDAPLWMERRSGALSADEGSFVARALDLKPIFELRARVEALRLAAKGSQTAGDSLLLAEALRAIRGPSGKYFSDETKVFVQGAESRRRRVILFKRVLIGVLVVAALIAGLLAFGILGVK